MFKNHMLMLAIICLVCVRVQSHLLILFFLGIIIPLIFLLILPRSSLQHFLFSVFVLCTILMMVSLYSFDLGFSIFSS